MEATLEVIGLVFVLGATFWQVFIVDRVQSIADDEKQIRVEEKLDSMWTILSFMYMMTFPKEAKLASSTPDLGAIFKKWKFAGPIDSFVGRQATRFRYVQHVIFIVGSLLIIGGKIPAAKPDLTQVLDLLSGMKQSQLALSTDLGRIRTELQATDAKADEIGRGVNDLHSTLAASRARSRRSARRRPIR